MQKINLYIFGAIACFWLLLFALTGLLNAGLHLGFDAYNIMLYFYKDGKTLSDDLLTSWGNMKTYMFSPIGVNYNLLIVKLFDAKIQIARWGYLFFAMMSSYFLFLVGRRIGFSVVLSLFWVALAFVGQQLWIWYSIHCQEPVGVFFMTMAMLLIAKSTQKSFLFDSLAILATICMSLSKESFILVIPALILFKYYFVSKEISPNTKESIIMGIVKSLFFCIPIGLLFIAEVLYILVVMQGGGRGYAGLSASLGMMDYLKHFFLLFSHNDVYAYLLFAILLVAFSSEGHWFKNIKKFIVENFLLLIFITLILVPQAIIYAKTGWYERYLEPSFISISLFIVLILHYLEQASAKQYYAILLTSLVFYLALEMTPKISDNPQQAFRYARNHVSTCEHSEALIQSVVEKSQPTSLILIVSDPVDNTVLPNGAESILRNIHQRANIKHLPISFPMEKMPNYEQRLAEIPKNFKDILDKKEINNILIMPLREELFLHETKDWFDMTKYQRVAFWKFVHYYKK